MDNKCFNKNKKNAFIAIVLFILIGSALLNYATPASANDDTSEIKPLVLYSTKDSEVNEYIRMLDLTVGAAAESVKYKSVNQVTEKDFKGITHLIYYGFSRNHITKPALKLIEEFNGPIFSIGHNVHQIDAHYEFLTFGSKYEITSYLKEDGITKTHVPSRGIAKRIMTDSATEILVRGLEYDHMTAHPVLVKKGTSYYFSMIHYSYPEALVVGSAIKDFLGIQEAQTRLGYIRLEDVHPLVDPENLKATGEIFAEHNIPYMIAVIPVYTDPETGRETHFSDSPKLLKVLKDMQDKGGSIVLHGYTHQFRKSETGEGFEFWDVENDRPIYAEADNENFVLKARADFPSAQAYEKYMDRLKAFESNYIRSRITRGIQELTNYGLYPLAFEAPHYTMSQNGYHTVAEFFNTYVGQIQLSDKNWETMDSSPFVTKPSLLPGLEVLPETLGYLPEDDPDALAVMQEKAALIQLTEDGIASAFYHPYLGPEGLLDVIEVMSSIPNIDWIDLKEKEITVQAENIVISTEDGQVVTDIQTAGLLMTSFDFPLYHIHEWVKTLSWVIAFTGLGMVTLFIIFIGIRRRHINEIEEV